MDDPFRLPYPEWQLSLREVIVEFDREKLTDKVVKAENMILERLQQLQQSSDGHNERRAIDDGLSTLRAIRRDRLGNPAC